MGNGFGINNFSNNKPSITGAHQAHDGGAGNLGYFEREEKERKEKEQAKKNESIFDKTKTDSFGGDGGEPEDEEFSVSRLIAQIILAVKDWFNKTFLGARPSEESQKERDSFEHGET